MLRVFADVLVPVLFMAALGGVVAHRLGMPIRPLAGLTFGVFSPALVFEALRDIEAGRGTVARIVVVVTIGFGVLALVSVAWSRLRRHDRPTLAAAALCSAVGNMGNMGIPIATLAFGQAGLDVAAVAFVASSVLTYSVGVVLASSASGSARAALVSPFRVPALWAALAALVVRAGGLDLPAAVETTSAALAGAAIPAMLVVLGLQVRQHTPTLDDVRGAVMPLVLRLCAGPALAAGLAVAVGLQGATLRTLVVLGGMPTAVNATILATQYRARPQLVTHTVVVSTLLSVITLTGLITWLT